VGIMWCRFGTPTGIAGSGTEEEYRIAYRKWQADNTMPLMFYFCQKPFMPRSVEEIDQMRHVLLLRQELEQKALFWEYSSPGAFEANIRKHLCVRMARMLEEQRQKITPTAKPDKESIENLKALWDRMTPELQRAFSVALRSLGPSGRQLTRVAFDSSSLHTSPLPFTFPSMSYRPQEFGCFCRAAWVWLPLLPEYHAITSRCP
jgi:hypothetical protein